jgi:hypothetical protein
MAISLMSCVVHVDDGHRRARTRRHQPPWAVTLMSTTPLLSAKIITTEAERRSVVDDLRNTQALKEAIKNGTALVDEILAMSDGKLTPDADRALALRAELLLRTALVAEEELLVRALAADNFVLAEAALVHARINLHVEAARALIQAVVFCAHTIVGNRLAANELPVLRELIAVAEEAFANSGRRGALAVIGEMIDYVAALRRVSAEARICAVSLRHLASDDAGLAWSKQMLLTYARAVCGLAEAGMAVHAICHALDSYEQGRIFNDGPGGTG